MIKVEALAIRATATCDCIWEDDGDPCMETLELILGPREPVEFSFLQRGWVKTIFKGSTYHFGLGITVKNTDRAVTLCPLCRDQHR